MMKIVFLTLSLSLCANLVVAMNQQEAEEQTAQHADFQDEDNHVAGAAAAFAGAHDDDRLQRSMRTTKILATTTALGWALTLALTAGWLIEHYVRDCEGSHQNDTGFLNNSNYSLPIINSSCWQYCEAFFNSSHRY